MGFGNGFTLRIRRPNFRAKLLEDMQAVTEGRLSNENNAQLIQKFSKVHTNVKSITRNGAFIATVGDTIVGDQTEKVGYPTLFKAGD